MSHLAKYIMNHNLISDDLDLIIKKELLEVDIKFYKYFKSINDKELILFAIDLNPDVMQFINTDFIDNDIINLMLTKNEYFIKYITGINDDIQKKIFSKNPFAIQNIAHKLSKDVLLHALSINGNVLKFIKNQDYNIILTATTNNPHALKYAKINFYDIERDVLLNNPDRIEIVEFIKLFPIEGYKQILQYEPLYIHKFNPDDLTDTVIDYAVLINPYIIKYLKEPSIQTQLLAVKQDGLLLEFCEQNYAIINAAVRENGIALKFVKKQSLQIVYHAVMNNVLALDYVDNPREFLFDIAFEKSALALKYIKNPTYEQMLNAVRRDGIVLEFIPDEYQTADIQLIALAGSGEKVIKYITKPKSDAVLFQFLKFNPNYIFEIENPTDEMFIKTFESNGGLILFWNDWKTKFSDTIINTALYNNGSLLKYIDNPNVNNIFYSLESYPFAIQWIIDAQNKDIVTKAVEINGASIQFVRPDLLSEELFDLAKKTIDLQSIYGFEIANYETFVKLKTLELSYL